jgi:ABC-type transport system substrate-binding protein
VHTIRRTIRRALTLAVLAAGAALLLAAAGSPRGIKEGGTFRTVEWSVGAIDPAFDPSLLRGAACCKLMGYPDKPVPEGLRLRPELAEAEPVVSRDGKTYTFTIRKDARFSDGKPVTARAFAHALERILTSAMQADGGFWSDIVGAKKMLAGKATTLDGAVAKGRTLTLRLIRRAPEFRLRMAELCAVPPNLPVDPEGVRAPLPSAAPYYAAQYVPGERLVLERNRFYKGNRVHHVDRFVATLVTDPRPFVDDVANGTLEHVSLRASDSAGLSAELARRYGVNRPGGQYFVQPGGSGLRMFVLNTSRPLFKNNPQLRQAVNFAADRRKLTRELGFRGGTATDQYLSPFTPGFRDERIYPLRGPNLEKARGLAKGHMRSGKVVVYTPNLPSRVAGGQILKENLEALGLEVEHVAQPPPVHFGKILTPGTPFDIADIGVSFGSNDPSLLNTLFDGRTIAYAPNFANASYFDSPKVNRLLDEASRLTGAARYRAYGELDVMISRDAAPAIPFANFSAHAFVSARVGCVVMNPSLDLTAVCLK